MTEKEYIEREAALNLIDRYWQQAYNAHFLDAAVRLGSVYREMEEIPAADVVEVVRCGECKHWKRIRNDCILASCELYELVRSEDFFCADGERRNDG